MRISDWSSDVCSSDLTRTSSSTFVSPCNDDGMNYLRDVAVDFVGLCDAAGATVKYQVGEPWWWAGGYRGDGPCFYDTFTQAAYVSETGDSVPTPFIETIYDHYEDDPDQVDRKSTRLNSSH